MLENLLEVLKIGKNLKTSDLKALTAKLRKIADLMSTLADALDGLSDGENAD